MKKIFLITALTVVIPFCFSQQALNIQTNPSSQGDGIIGSWSLVMQAFDENNNGKLDKNLVGIPLEPYGFSNNARGFLGPPSFGDARFQVSGPNTRIEVRLE